MATISKNVNPLSFEKLDTDTKLESAIAVDGIVNYRFLFFDRVYIDSVIFKGQIIPINQFVQIIQYLDSIPRLMS